MSSFYEAEFELESRVLGDIDYHADHPDNFASFFDFTVEEIKSRYQDFLNLTSEGEDGGEQQQEPGEGGLVVDFDGEIFQEKQTQHEIDANLAHEIEELKNSSIETAFQDFNFWKPQVDYNLDELLSEMNGN